MPVIAATEPTKTLSQIGREKAAEDHVAIAIVVLPYRYEPTAKKAHDAVLEWCRRRLDAAQPEIRAALEQNGHPVTTATINTVLNEWYCGLDAIVSGMWR